VKVQRGRLSSPAHDNVPGLLADLRNHFLAALPDPVRQLSLIYKVFSAGAVRDLLSAHLGVACSCFFQNKWDPGWSIEKTREPAIFLFNYFEIQSTFSLFVNKVFE
jgi:hypothetical protein